MDYKFHKLCVLFPQADDKTLDDMANDIKANGLNEPIMIYEGQILDGRNRYLACLRAGVEPTFKEYVGDEALQFVVSKNLHRRHLSDVQRAMLADKIIKMNNIESSDFLEMTAIREQFNISQKDLDEVGKLKAFSDEDIQNKVSDGYMTMAEANKMVELSKKAVGVVHKNNPTPSEVSKMKTTQKRMLSDSAYFDIVKKNAVEYNPQVLSGVYDGSRFRRDINMIQQIVAKIDTLPSLFNEAMDLVGTLDQERMLIAVLDSLTFNLRKAEKKFQSSSTSYDEALSIVASILNERFKLPDIEQSAESKTMEILKAKYFSEVSQCLKEISDIKKKLDKRKN